MKRSLQIKKLKWPLSEFQKNINLLNIEIFIFILILSIVSLSARANNIKISNVTLTGQDGFNHFTYVQFDLSWDNSWRVAAGPNNWDAAWVFVKFQITGGGAGCTASTAWNHAFLSSADGDHTIGNDNGVNATIKAQGDMRGVFIYRSTNGSGSNLWQTIKLRWNYGANSVDDGCKVSVKVFAIEMVYVPTGGFFAGDGSTTSAGRFEAGNSGQPFSVTTATTPSVLGGGGAGSMGNNNNASMGQADDFATSGATQALLASYPNGFNNFYCMKYEVSQEQYAEFLNTLTVTQQANRTFAVALNAFQGPAAGGLATPQSRNGVKVRVAPFGTMAGEYGCDLNNDGTFNDANVDGRFIAMNFISSNDVLAYLDWSGLRPMTELEFEKTCRGPLNAVAGEFAWGTVAMVAATNIASTGAEAETATPASANANFGNNLPAGIAGPLRCGVFATAASIRTAAGSSYYGIMELTGNVWEDVVGLGTVAGRSYTGLHGDGKLNDAGDADVNNWPGINANNSLTTPNGVYGGTNGCKGIAGIGFAGGSYISTFNGQVSERQHHNFLSALGNRDQRNGGRGVRTP